jgi:NADP-dependent 3-hydroxy acid dehydrogenase YdfG
MFDLSGKTALISGGSRGIGAATARAFAQQGADIAISYHTREDAAQAVVTEIAQMGRRAFAFASDARDMAQLQALWKEAESALGHIDILVNNAGLLKNGFLAMTSEASWDEVLDVNLKGAFQLSKLAAKAMNRAKRGRIINISSQSAQMGDVMRAPYSAQSRTYRFDQSNRARTRRFRRDVQRACPRLHRNRHDNRRRNSPRRRNANWCRLDASASRREVAALIHFWPATKLLTSRASASPSTAACACRARLRVLDGSNSNAISSRSARWRF